MRHLPVHDLPHPADRGAGGVLHLQHFDGGADGGERVAEFVGEHRQELVLPAVGVPQRLLGPSHPQQGVHRGDQFDGLDRVAQVGVRPAVQPLDPVPGHSERGGQVEHRDGGGGRVRLDLLAHLEPVRVGQVHVEDDEIGVVTN
jgi:hypothetical protein